MCPITVIILYVFCGSPVQSSRCNIEFLTSKYYLYSDSPRYFFFNILDNMNRALLSRGVLTIRRNVAYRQEMPPPGGYGYMPWRRNIPQRGYGFFCMSLCEILSKILKFNFSYLLCWLDMVVHRNVVE